MIGEHIGELKKWAAEAAHGGKTGDQIHWHPAIYLVSKHFSVKSDEVAILSVTPDEKFLKFLAPENLRPVGRIPLSSTASLAARTVRERRAELINRFAVVPHASVFEGVPVGDTKRVQAIQKIMSAPLVVERKAVGVLQVSRKGESTTDAGPDFTNAQLHDLKLIAEILAPCALLNSPATLA